VSRSATLAVEPLEVQPRWLLHVVILLVLLAAIVGMAALRRGDLDFEDDVWAVGVLLLSFWLAALALGSLVRSVRAGYALRLDARGLHVPGLDVVPWRDVLGADLREYERMGKRFAQLIVHVDVERDRKALAHYECYLFGPWAGLHGSRGKIVVPVMLLAVEPKSLLARTREFVARGGMIATVKRDAASTRKAKRAEGRRAP
jgi:hypothetical protein